MEWFTADPHFGHSNIIRHCSRPFGSAEQMDEEILRRWNAVLRPGDRLYILGDFCGQRRRAEVISSYLERIQLHPAAITLVLGNHDDEQQSRKAFRHVERLYEFKSRRDGPHLVLCHWAMRTWNGSHRGTGHLHGHSHGTLPEDPHSLSFDCGVDPNDFRLLPYDEVVSRLSRKVFIPVDRHKSDGKFEA